MHFIVTVKSGALSILRFESDPNIILSLSYNDVIMSTDKPPILIKDW